MAIIKPAKPSKLCLHSFPPLGLVAIVLQFYTISAPYAASADVLEQEQKSLIGLDLTQLLNQNVTSVSKKEQNAFQSAAAVFIVTQNDIQHSGATSIPAILRMVPGLNVASIDGNKWAVSARGFNGRFSNKLLVMIDGRTIYTPTYSGVSWEMHDTLLADIERIEVIRGPGAAQWGSNAVNGVINIITKKAKDTQGGYLEAGAGSKETVFAGGRYGGKIGDNTYYRVYAKYFDRANNRGFNNEPVSDNWNMERGGFKLEWSPSEKNTFTAQGDIYEATLNSTMSLVDFNTRSNPRRNATGKRNGGNILLNWSGQAIDEHDSKLRLYYDYSATDDLWVSQKKTTFDLDFQDNFKLFEDHDVLWGFGYRFVNDRLDNTASLQFFPNQRDYHLFSFSLQDTITLIPEQLKVILASRFEHNDFSGFEGQPTLRLVWTPDEKQTVWAAVSRAVRTPALAEEGARINRQFSPAQPPQRPLPTLVSLVGIKDRTAEDVIAYELGYRIQPHPNFSVDLTGFYNVYNNINSFQQGQPYLENNHFTLPIYLGSNMTGETYGAELVVNWQIRDNWKIAANYSYLQMQLHMKNGASSNDDQSTENSSPHHTTSIFSQLNMTPETDFDIWLRYVDRIPQLNIPSYTTLDARLAWRPIPKIELSITGQNLLDKYHPEYRAEFFNMTPSQVSRGVYGKVQWSF